ncbi:TatD family hydrolase [Psychromonas sp. Urea-02u-13]|uniref:TatD family hydrolase n=1 Tax=Psychromonas sp. Urea-02u-13 TaxID=2058326 RepID=UPI000C31B9D0|nr:TatD family hydrolase [Psychromonas sp. Urea-02u-13]PKG39354.1 TatD family deoxyribonuclease [Psychromonas sp. Urea-02u-13]
MFTDSHCHLDFPCFKDELDPLLAALKQKGITKLVIPATQASAWPMIKEMASAHSPLYYSLGIHPHFLDSFEEVHLAHLHDMLLSRDDKCIALGEIGLDKFAQASQTQQEWVFVKQVEIALQLELPIILHCVKKQGRVLAILKALNFQQGGVYHAFSGSLEVAHEFIKLGFKLGVGAVITYPNSTKTRQTFATLPLDALLLETDAPDMPLYQQQTKNNSPLNIIPIFECLASLRSEPKAQLATQLYNNMHNIFSLSND